MQLTLHVWRQKNATDKGRLEKFNARPTSQRHVVPGDARSSSTRSFIEKGNRPDSFRSRLPRRYLRHVLDGDQRLVPHGPEEGTTVCQLHMRHFKDGDHIYIEPWRARAFPIVKDLVVDRSAFDRIIQAGGFISVNTGGAPDANAIPIPKDDAERCDGLPPPVSGVAPVSRPARMLRPCCLSPPKVSQFAHLPQGQVERGAPGEGHGRPDGRRNIRLLHQPVSSARRSARRTSRLDDRQDEPRICQGSRQGRGKEGGCRRLLIGIISMRKRRRAPTGARLYCSKRFSARPS